MKPNVIWVFGDQHRAQAMGHLGGHNTLEFIPRDERGRFDIWLGYENTNAPFDCWIHGHDLDGRDDREPLVEKMEPYETDGLTDRLIGFLEKQTEGDPPFFAVLSVTPPHNPYVAPPEFERRYSPETVQLRPNVPDIPRITDAARKDLAGHYAQIENLDWNLGRVLETLKKQGLDRNTHIFFFSDHGDMHGSHGYTKKSSPWEESLRIPCMVLPAGGRRVGAESDAPFNHVDFAPTSLGLCGIEAPDWMLGTDFSHDVIPGRPAPVDEPNSAYIQQCVRKRFQSLNRTWRGIRTRDNWKYVCLEGQPLMMFNLNEDPYELANLAYLDTFNDKRAELQAELAGWIERTGDTFALPEL